MTAMKLFIEYYGTRHCNNEYKNINIIKKNCNQKYVWLKSNNKMKEHKVI